MQYICICTDRVYCIVYISSHTQYTSEWAVYRNINSMEYDYDYGAMTMTMSLYDSNCQWLGYTYNAIHQLSVVSFIFVCEATKLLVCHPVYVIITYK